MILGMSTATYTFLHVLVSLVGIGSGLIVMFGLLTGKRLDGWTAIFLATTVLTSLSGFAFPVDHLLPSHIVCIISLVVIGDRNSGSLRHAPGWRLALDLCRRGRSGALPQCLCRGGILWHLTSGGAGRRRADCDFNRMGNAQPER